MAFSLMHNTKLRVVQVNIRDLKQTTKAAATRSWQNKRSKEHNNSTARAFSNFVHFLAFFSKTTT